MAQTGYTPIQLYYSTTAAAVPVNTNLADGELAINITDGKLYYKNNAGTVTLLAGATAGPAGGSNTQVQFNSSGVLAGSANMTFNGTRLTVADLADSGLTSGRVTYASTGGALVDSANLTFDGTTLTPNALTVTNAVTLTAATANGVMYANGSKVLTTGSALTFDGTRLGVGVSPTQSIDANGTILARSNLIAYGALVLQRSSSSLELPVAAYTNGSGSILSGGTKGDIVAFGNAGGDGVIFANSNAEQMRLTSTGLGIGTSSPGTKLDVVGTIRTSVASGNSAININNSSLTGKSWDLLPNTASGESDLLWYYGGASAGVRMTLTNSGNLGLGRTPVAYGSFRVLDVAGSAGAIQKWVHTGSTVELQAYASSTVTAVGSATNHPLTFTTNDTERARITSSGNFCIGSTEPGNAGALNLSVGNPGTTVGGLQLWSTTSGTHYVQFGDSTSGAAPYSGAVGYSHASDAMLFLTSGSERFRIGSAGQIGLSGANYGTSGQVLTSQGAGAAPIWAAGGGGGGSAATPTALGTVYGATSIGSPFSTFLGYQAGTAITTGQFNTMAGWQSGLSITSGSRNAFFGIYSGVFTTTGVENTFVGGMDSPGWGAGHLNTTGSFNTAIGTSALRSNTTASNNTAVGYQAAYLNTTGYNNAVVGQQAFYYNTTGALNTAMGDSSLGANTTGNSNTAVGRSALGSNTTASDNTAVGYQAAYLNTTGNSLVAVGTYALYDNSTGASNVAVGISSLENNTTGSNNVAVGFQAGFSNTTAAGQTHVGYQAGRLATGEWNTCIGNETGRTITTGIQNTMIGAYNGVYVVELTTGSYNITLGTYSGPSAANSNYEMVIGYNTRGKGSSTGFINSNGGGVFQGNNSSSWSTTSDQRLKKNIADNNVGLEKLTQIQIRNFEYRLPEEVDAALKPSDAVQKTGVQLGVIAQELQSVLPECVRQESTGVLTVDTDNLTWYLINAVKQLKAEIDQLKGN